MSSTKEAALEIRAKILAAFGPPSKGKQLSKVEIATATGLPVGKVAHHAWVLLQEGALEIVDKQRGEGQRGRAADVYARVATA